MIFLLLVKSKLNTLELGAKKDSSQCQLSLSLSPLLSVCQLSEMTDEKVNNEETKESELCCFFLIHRKIKFRVLYKEVQI